jgi:hypothetical protein
MARTYRFPASGFRVVTLLTRPVWALCTIGFCENVCRPGPCQEDVHGRAPNSVNLFEKPRMAGG